MSKRGRTPILNDAKRRVVCAILAKGGTLGEAAECLQCSVRTLQLERKRNPRFRQQVCEAKAQAMLMPFFIMHKEAGSKWRAASWMIRREDDRRRELASMRDDHGFQIHQADEGPSFLEELRRAGQQPSQSPREIPPGFARDCPRATAKVLATRAGCSSD
ncbi:MAG: hypothetical protein WD851_24065 [Pirellulales bacterium]